MKLPKRLNPPWAMRHMYVYGMLVEQARTWKFEAKGLLRGGHHDLARNALAHARERARQARETLDLLRTTGALGR